MILVVSVNSNICKIYQYIPHPAELIVIKEIHHPESRLQNRDLVADREGRYQGSQTPRGAYSPHMEAKEIEVERFAREITEELNHKKNNNELDRLIIIAAPRMRGVLHSHFNKQIQDLISHEIHKDLLYMPDHELLNYVVDHTRYTGA